MLPEEAVSSKDVVEYVGGELVNSRLAMSFLVRAFLDRWGEETIEIAKKALYHAGSVLGSGLSKKVEEKSIPNLVRMMLAFPYNQIFDAKIEHLSEDKAVIHWRLCPLKEKFKEMSMSESEMRILCPILEQYDVGIVEGFDPRFKCVPPKGPQGPCKCEIYLRKT